MKTVSLFFVLLLTLAPLRSFAQYVGENPSPDIADYSPVEEGSLQSELVTPVTDEVASPSDDYDRSDDPVIGEVSEWSPQSDDLSTEDFE